MASFSGPNLPPPPKDAQGEEIPLNPLVSALVTDPDNPPDAIVLSGFIGLSPREGFVRIYADLGFRKYVELPGDEVLYVLPSDEEEPEAPSKVFVNATARIEVIQAVEASFLEGGILSRYPLSAGHEIWAWPALGKGKCPHPEGGTSHTHRCAHPEGGTSHTHRCAHPEGGTSHTLGCAHPEGGTSHTQGDQAVERAAQVPRMCRGTPHTHGAPGT